jgi:RNA polymerase sigma-70 factor, ECF subfamily
MQPITQTPIKMERRSFRLTEWWRRQRADTHEWTAEALQNQYLDKIFAYALRRLGNVAEAEDVAAEVFAAVFARLSHCPAPLENRTGTENGDPTVAYLFGIAHRKVADALRKRTRNKETEMEEEIFPLLTENPEVEMLTTEAHQMLWEIIYKLKDEYREILLLKYVEERSLKEIAQIMQKTPTQVGSILQQAREAAHKQDKGYFA